MSTSKANKHSASGYSLSTHCSFDGNKSESNFYRGEDSMKNRSANINEHATEIIDCEKEEMLPLTEKEGESYKNHERRIQWNFNENEIYSRVWDHCHCIIRVCKV